MNLPPSSKQRFRLFRSSFTKDENESGSSQLSDEEKRARRRRYLRLYRRWLAPYGGGLVTVFLLAILAMGMEMTLPLATRHIIDDILLGERFEETERLVRLHTVGLGVLIILMLMAAIIVFRTYRLQVLNARIIFSLRERLFDKLVQLPLSSLSDMKSGGIVSRLSGDVDNVTGLVQSALISPGVALIKVGVTLGILLSMRWQLALAAAAMLPPMTLLSLLWVRRGRPIYRSMAKDRNLVDARVAETFGGIRVVRSFLGERKEALDYAVGHHTIIRKKILADLIAITVDAGWSLVIPLISLVIVWFGGLLYLAKVTTLGDIVAFEMYAGILLQPVWRIVMSLSEVQRSLASMDRVFEILEMDDDKPDAPDALPAPSTIEEIRLENVSFAYRDDTYVLHDLDLSFKGGQTVAFVGPSGAGKTTLTDLIARFHDPTKGRVLLNGIDLKMLKLKEFRSLLGIVQQDIFLFDGTVRENIAYGKRDATLEEVQEAARRACAHDFITELSNGYDTLIGERGVKLSGGQRQRLSIARAILADPKILILDEATSNLDTESEQEIQEALKELFAGRTTFVIAHRLSTVTHANLIVVLDKGYVMEVGDHVTLMARRGKYYEMVERQRTAF